MASTCVAVMLSSRGHPAAWCTSTVYSAASCFKLETTYVSAWKQVQKKKRSDSKPLFHAPLVHQGNNRLIQRLRSGPLESESCSHGGFGMAGVRQSLSGCVVLGTLHTLWQAQTNSGTQSRPWHQTPLCQNRAVFRRRRAQNPNNQHAFFFFPPSGARWRRPTSPSPRLREEECSSNLSCWMETRANKHVGNWVWSGEKPHNLLHFQRWTDNMAVFTMALSHLDVCREREASITYPAPHSNLHILPCYSM